MAKEWSKKNGITEYPTLKAEVNHGRWIVNCPFCNNAEFLFDEYFYCNQCKNEGIQGGIYKVEIPKERNRIEELLEKRPIKNRNWLSTETVEQLEEENIEHKEELI